ncbi:MAG: hypothetical protein MPJ24_03380 [Pirellulaceae bacterium]|nr:hypothetical protein [Pirellulaceae bacterium]
MQFSLRSMIYLTIVLSLLFFLLNLEIIVPMGGEIAIFILGTPLLLVAFAFAFCNSPLWSSTAIGVLVGAGVLGWSRMLMFGEYSTEQAVFLGVVMPVIAPIYGSPASGVNIWLAWGIIGGGVGWLVGHFDQKYDLTKTLYQYSRRTLSALYGAGFLVALTLALSGHIFLAVLLVSDALFIAVVVLLFCLKSGPMKAFTLTHLTGLAYTAPLGAVVSVNNGGGEIGIIGGYLLATICVLAFSFISAGACSRINRMHSDGEAMAEEEMSVDDPQEANIHPLDIVEGEATKRDQPEAN